MISDYYRINEGIKVSPGQIAAYFIHRDITDIKIKDATSQ
jgi:hypothetical protein